MVADVRDLIKKEFVSPHVNVRLPRYRSFDRASDFMADNPLRGGSNDQRLGMVLPQYQTTGAVAGRRSSESAGGAEYLLDSLGENATEQEKEYLRRVIAAGGYDPEQDQGGLMKVFMGLLRTIDTPRRLVNAAIADAFNIGEEFSYREAAKQILGGKPSADPDAVQGLQQFRTEDSGELLFTGSQLLRAGGWDTADDEANVFEKALRGTLGFGIDFVTDPLNWVSWGTLGLGRASAQAAARTSIAGSVREAAEALIRTGTLDDVADPFAQRMGRELLEEGKDVRANIFDRVASKESERLGRKLTPTEEAVLRKNVDVAYYQQQANQAAAAVGVRKKDWLNPKVWSDEIAEKVDDDLVSQIDEMLQEVDSPIEAIYDDIFDLIDRKQFATLEDRYSDFVKSKKTGAWATGGMTITTPFARKTMGGLKIGFRTNRGLTKIPREVIAERWAKLPYDGMRGAIESVYRRWGIEVGEMAARRQVGAWTLDRSLGLARHAVQELGVDTAPGMIEASLRGLREVAEKQGVNIDEHWTVLSRALDEGWDKGRMIAAIPDKALHDATETAYEEIKTTLQTIHTALQKYDPGMGKIDNYFPMVATPEFVKLVEKTVELGIHDTRAARLIASSLEESFEGTDTQRFGLNILAEWFDAAADAKEAVGSGVRTVDRTRFQSKRNLTKTLFSQVGGMPVGVLNKDEAARLLGEGVEVGWAARVEINKAITEALEMLRERGAFGGRVRLEQIQAFSDDLPAVLDSYVKATTNVIHWRALLREAKKVGMVGEVPKALEIGNTIANLTHGPLSRENQSLINAFERWAKGTGSRPKSRAVEIIEGWVVDLPEEIANDARVVRAFTALRENVERASKQTGDIVRALEEDVRQLVLEGVDEALAREAVLSFSSKHMRDVQAALFETLADKSAQLRSTVNEMVANVPAEKSYATIRAAIEQTEEWASQARRTLAQLRDQYAETFGFTRISSDKVVDLLTPLENGQTPLSVLLPKMRQSVDETFLQRLETWVTSPWERSRIKAEASTWDIRASIARALDEEVNERVMPEALQSAWEDVAAAVEASNMTFPDLVEAVGAHDAVRVLRKLAGFAEPEFSDDVLREVAEDFAAKRGSSYMPRRVSTVGDSRAIREEYEALDMVSFNDDFAKQGQSAADAFGAWVYETKQQYDALVRRGIRFEPYVGKGMPYPNQADQVKDIIENRHVWVPIVMDPREADIFNEVVDGMPLGNLFDSMHIVMGHAMHGFDTTTMQGVTEAWLAHGQLYSDQAREAFTTLTRGRRIASRAYRGQPRVLPRKMDLMSPEVMALNLGEFRGQSELAHGLIGKADEQFGALFDAERQLKRAKDELADVRANAPVAYHIEDDVVKTGAKKFKVRLENGTVMEFGSDADAKRYLAKQGKKWLAAREEVAKAEAKFIGPEESRMGRRLRSVPPPRPANRAKWDTPTFQTFEEGVEALQRDLDALRKYRSDVRAQLLGEGLSELEGKTPAGRPVPTAERAEEALRRARQVQGPIPEDMPNMVRRVREAAEEGEEYAPLAKVSGTEFRSYASDQLNVERVLGRGLPEPPQLEILVKEDLVGLPMYGSVADFNEWYDRTLLEYHIGVGGGEAGVPWVRDPDLLDINFATTNAGDYITINTPEAAMVKPKMRGKEFGEGWTPKDEQAGELLSPKPKPKKRLQVEVEPVEKSRGPALHIEMGSGATKKIPLPKGWAGKVTEALEAGDQSVLDALFQDAMNLGLKYRQGLVEKWERLSVQQREAWETLTGKFAKGVNLREFMDDLPPGLRDGDWAHEVFSDPAFVGMHAAARSKLGAADGHQEVGQWLQQKMKATQELVDNARMLDSPINPRSNVMEEIARAASIPGDATELARYEEEVKWLFGNMGLDPKRVHFEVMADGTTRFQYLAGDLVEENVLIPPDEIRLWMEDHLPMDVWAMSEENLVRAVKEAYDSGLLDMSQFPDELRRFVQNLPDDAMLSLESSRAAYLREFIAQLQVARSTLRRQLKGSTSRQIDAAADAAKEILDEVTPMLRRRVGDPERLDELWDTHRNLLERVLPEREFNELMGLVEVAPTLRASTARARSLVGKNSARRWVKVSDAYDTFERTKDEVAAELFKMGPDILRENDLKQVLSGLDLLRENFFRVARRGRATAESAGLDIVPETPKGFRQVTTDKGVIEEVGQELEQLKRGLKQTGINLRAQAGDVDFQNYLARELGDLLPKDGQDIEEWIRAKASQFVRADIEAEYTPVMTQARMIRPETFGVTGEELVGMNVDSAFAVVLESMASNIQAMTSPVGIRLLADGVRGFERFWKGAVTVGRPTFVPRNVMGGVFNNGIIDVGPREYAWVAGKARTVRKALDRGEGWEGAMKHLSAADAEVFEAARSMRLFDAEFSSDIADPLMGRAKSTLNPTAGILGGDKTFIGFDIGGKFMQTSEDFLRMAAFRRWYVNGVPETAALASNLSFAVHFDYSSLTRLETKVKKFIPFFVWTRRNIPLQAKLLVERPGIYNRYANLMRNAQTSFQEDEYSFADRQPIPSWMGGFAADLDTVVDRGDGVWTRFFFAPDIPTRDLEQLVQRFSSGNPFSNGLGFVLDMLSPAIGTSTDLATNPDFFEGNKVTAPTGLAGILKVLNAMGLWWGDTKGGQPQISYGTRSMWETAFPFIREWTEVAGIAPNDGMRSGDLGYRLDDGISLEERALGAFMGIGKAFGLRGTTPHDTLSPVVEAEQTIRAIERAAIGDLRLPLGGAQGAPREPYVDATNDASSHYVNGQYVSVVDAADALGRPVDNGRVVVDGDTLKLKLPDGTTERVRLLGVNTPEKGEMGYEAATAFLQELLAQGGQIRLVPDLVDRDPYGRLLRYVWVGDRMVNLELVEKGLAQPQPYYPNRAFEQLLDAAS